MEKTIKIAVEGKQVVPYNKLEPFQDELKTLDKERYEKLRAGILELGFSFVFHVWKNKNKFYIIDGHQRLFTLSQLAEVEGFKVPAVPVALVKAKNFHEAKLKVLAGASQYGRLSEKGLHAFMEANDIPFEFAAATYDFAEIEFASLGEKFFDNNSEPTLPPAQGGGTAPMPSSSEGVRQVQLLFDAASHEEFLKKSEALGGVYETENITDTVMGAIRAEYKAQFPKSK